MTNIFVYGTLKKGYRFHNEYLGKGKFLTEDKIDGELYMQPRGLFPLIFEGKDKIAGEVYQVDERTLDGIRYLEKGYIETVITTDKGHKCLVYFATADTYGGKPDKKYRIADFNNEVINQFAKLLKG